MTWMALGITELEYVGKDCTIGVGLSDCRGRGSSLETATVAVRGELFRLVVATIGGSMGFL